MKSIITALFIFSTLLVYSQTQKFSGQIKTATGKVIPYANVVLRGSDNIIISYTSSDIDGYFSFALAEAVTPDYKIEINHLGYKKTIVPLLKAKTSYQITLQEQAIDLAAVEVKSPPAIRSNNDTLSYDVESFTKSEDRTIGDVLKRMPGIEIEENGQIKYNGKNISNFYVDGDDLLNDRYNIGTKTIPHDMVSGVEVLQNHQPVEVLRNKSYSDDVAINLKIKEEAKARLTGQAKIAGGTPNLYNTELNTILFNSKNKMLNTVQANNTGVDLAKDLTAFNAENMLQSMNNQRPGELLSAGTIAEPNIPKERYNFNHAASLSANYLSNLRDGSQLKSNIALLYDRYHMNYSGWNNIYLNKDTIRYSETQNIGNTPFVSDVMISLKNNKSKYYFSNTLKANFSVTTGAADLQSNIAPFSQQLKTEKYDFSNTLNYIPLLNNQHILNFNWYLNYYNQPQSLTISPGINEGVLNDSIPYQVLSQLTDLPTWFSNILFSYRIPQGSIRQHYSVALVNEWQHLVSDLSLLQANGQETSYDGSADNNLFWRRSRLNITPSFEYEKGAWESLLSLPLSIQNIVYEDPGFRLKERYHKWLFDPTWNLNYKLNSEDYFAFSYAYNNQVGNISDLYRGAILTNYRSLQANSASLQEKNVHNIGLRYNYQRSLQMLFMNASINYSRVSSNAMLSQVASDSFLQTVLLPFHNKSHTLTTSAGISKYLFDIDINIGTNISWSTMRYNQFLNAQLLPFKQLSFTLNPYIETSLLNVAFLKYSAKGTWTTSKINTEEAGNNLGNRQLKLMDQSINLTVTPFKNVFLKWSGRQLLTIQKETEGANYFFTDLNIRYQIAQWKADIELDLTNIANITSYGLYTLSSNQFNYSEYDLRGRMLLLRLSFRL